jgi:hypothetical protein
VTKFSFTGGQASTNFTQGVTTKNSVGRPLNEVKPYTVPAASRVKCRAAGVLHRKLDFAWQTGIQLVLHSHASVWKPASIRQLCACGGEAGTTKKSKEPKSLV